MTKSKNKICTHCGELKLLVDFPPNKRTKDGRSSWCRACYAEDNKKRRERNPNYNRKYKEKWNKKVGTEYIKRYHGNYRGDLRKQAIERLGGKCIKCELDDPRVLQIDHINGGGAKERKSYGNARTHREIRDMPESELHKKYQLLCANCHQIKTIYEKEHKKFTPLDI